MNNKAIEILSPKLLAKKFIMKGMKSDIQGSFNYLMETTLLTPINNELFIEEVTGYYKTRLDLNGNIHGYIPSLYEIVDFIDEENMTIIDNFCYSMGYNDEDIDAIEAHYVHNVSCILDDWVAKVLKDLGYAYTGQTFYNLFEIKRSIVEMYAPQNILLMEFLT